jgi:hypothetical protein
MTTRTLTPLIPLLALATACSQPATSTPPPPDILTHGDPFVAIERTLDADIAATLQARRTTAGPRGIESVPSPTAPTSFYLAIKKSELNQRYFLSAYLQQYFPDAVYSGAAASLGTRVVTFRVQNGKLYVFDASDNYASSDTFDPELILEAYPIVGNYPVFGSLPGHDDYLLFDPAAGLNRFDLFVGDLNAWWFGAHFQIDLAFLQNFRRIADGATFEEVFSGTSNDVPTGFALDVQHNPFRGQGTLGIALRRYSEGAGYTAKMPAFDDAEYFFRSDVHIDKNVGTRSQSWVRWNFHPGQAPVTWQISPLLVKAQQQRYPDYDIVGAVKKGIEGWNAVLGYPALKAEIAPIGAAFSDDDRNYLIFDSDPTVGFAFADWRTNPNTGEVRGASVYFNELWISGAIDYFRWIDSATSASGAPKPAKPPTAKTPRLIGFGWSKLKPQPLCTLSVDEVLGKLDAPKGGTSSGDVPSDKLKQDVEHLIQHLIAHEIGHTLGLRHNFKGSLQPVSSTVMEYLYDDLRVQVATPQPYDIAAIGYLYDLPGAARPSQPFCTDEDTMLDPMCARFDYATDPLNEDHGPLYQLYVDWIFRYDWFTVDLVSGYRPLWNNILAFVRAGSDAQALQALDWMRYGTSIGATAPPGAVADWSTRVNQLTRIWIARLYLDPVNYRGPIASDAHLTGAALTKVIDELYGNLANTDGIRDFATRRLTIDALKKLQNDAAYDALVRAKVVITAARPGLGGIDAELTDDLLARLDAAITPYYN